jgi:hypothetical protein
LALDNDGIDFKLDHDLRNIYRTVKESTDKYCPEDILFKEMESEINEIVENFELIDKDSFSFRYPMNMRLKPMKEQTISLATFANVMNRGLKKLDMFVSLCIAM